MKKLFGGLRLTWGRLILFAVAAGVYTGFIAMLPAAKDTSFADISISFEVWVLFGVLIIMNSASPLDSALKCFVFFLISQPLVYLVQVPFSALGWGLFGFYRYWFYWTLLTFPMGFAGYFMKRDKWWGLLILTPPLALVGYHASGFFGMTRFLFPRHLLSLLFCAATMLLYPVCIFKNRRNRIAGLIISLLILLGAAVFSFLRPNTYATTLLMDGGEAGAAFDERFAVRLADERFGSVRIDYDSGIEKHLVNAEFVRGGKTELILTAPDGSESVYALDVGYSDFEIEKK